MLNVTFEKASLNIFLLAVAIAPSNSTYNHARLFAQIRTQSRATAASQYTPRQTARSAWHRISMTVCGGPGRRVNELGSDGAPTGHHGSPVPPRTSPLLPRASPLFPVLRTLPCSSSGRRMASASLCRPHFACRAAKDGMAGSVMASLTLVVTRYQVGNWNRLKRVP